MNAQVMSGRDGRALAGLLLVACDPFGDDSGTGGDPGGGTNWPPTITIDSANWPKVFLPDTLYQLPVMYSGSCSIEARPVFPGLVLTRNDEDPPGVFRLLVNLFQPREDSIRITEVCSGNARYSVAYPFGGRRLKPGSRRSSPRSSGCTGMSRPGVATGTRRRIPRA